jgi:hypothetical protein
MDNNTNNVILKALLSALKPLARLLMKSGIGYREFAELSKCAFVDVATSDYGLRGRPTNISRVAVMTGLTRKEVKRLRDKIAAGDESKVVRVTSHANILGKWHTDPEYLDELGKPRVLVFDGPTPSFTSLVKKYGGDIPAGAMRTELKRVGAISEEPNNGLTVQKRDFNPGQQEMWVERALGLALRGLSSTLNFNFDHRDDSGRAERIVYSDKIRLDDIVRVRRISRDRLTDFLQSVDDVYSAYETIYGEGQPDLDDCVTLSVGVGVYYFELENQH